MLVASAVAEALDAPQAVRCPNPERFGLVPVQTRAGAQVLAVRCDAQLGRKRFIATTRRAPAASKWSEMNAAEIFESVAV